jgi:hypothetical protein
MTCLGVAYLLYCSSRRTVRNKLVAFQIPSFSDAGEDRRSQPYGFVSSAADRKNLYGRIDALRRLFLVDDGIARKRSADPAAKGNGDGPDQRACASRIRLIA